jgi:hypothetical protein
VRILISIPLDVLTLDPFRKHKTTNRLNRLIRWRLSLIHGPRFLTSPGNTSLAILLLQSKSQIPTQPQQQGQPIVSIGMGSACGVISGIWFTNTGMTWSPKPIKNDTSSIQGLTVKLYKGLPWILELQMRVMSTFASMLTLSLSTLPLLMAVMAPLDQGIDTRNWNVGEMASKEIMWPVYLIS